MKGILVINMPYCCEMCYLSMQVVQGSLCTGTRGEQGGKMINGCFGTKPSWCPLKPIPEELPTPYMMRQIMISEGIQTEKPPYTEDYQKGFNDCLYEILGEEE